MVGQPYPIFRPVEWGTLSMHLSCIHPENDKDPSMSGPYPNCRIQVCAQMNMVPGHPKDPLLLNGLKNLLMSAVPENLWRGLRGKFKVYR